MKRSIKMCFKSPPQKSKIHKVLQKSFAFLFWCVCSSHILKVEMITLVALMMKKG